MCRRAFLSAVFCLCCNVLAQQEQPRPLNDIDAPQILRTPDGRNRTEMILKAEHESSMKDVDAIRRLIEDVKIDMEKNDRHVLSVATLKKLDEIEKLTKKIRARMKRF